MWEQSRVVLRAARGARTLSEFPLVSVLRDVGIVRLTLVSCGRSNFCVGDIESVTLESLSGKHIPALRET